jgi:hypothetical protein
VTTRTNTKGFFVVPRPMAADWQKDVTFAAPGDSGAAVVTVADNKVVGILTGGGDLTLPNSPVIRASYVTPIQLILDRYSGGTPAGTPKLVVAIATSNTDVRTVPGVARVALPAEVLLDRTQAAALEQQVRQTSVGCELADLY